MRANDRLLLLAHPRSGSSNLYEILQSHPALKISNEPFNESHAQWAPGNKDYQQLVHDQTSLDAALGEILTEFNGLKLLSYQLREDWVVRLIGRPDFRVVFLRRRNLLQAVVSNLIAHQTGLWHRWDTPRPIDDYYAELQPLDIADVSTRVTQLAQHLQKLEAAIDERTDGRTQTLLYEDLFYASPTEQDRALENLWQFLELDPLRSDRVDYFLRPERSKLNSTETYRLLPNLAEIENECGADATGHLL